MATHTPLTTNVRAAYASAQDFFFEDDEAGRAPRPTSYAERALGFDQWLDAIVAVAKAQGFAEGKAAAVSDIATGNS